MGETWKKLLASSVICHALAYGVILLVSVFSFTTRTVLVEFQWSWVTARTWAEFLRLGPVWQGWATLLVFGWIVPMQSSGAARSTFDRFGRSIALLLFLTLSFAAAYLVGYPAAASRVESLEFASTLATELRRSAAEARSNQNYTKALSDLDQYLALVGESEEVEETLIQVRDEARADAMRVESGRDEQRFAIPESASAAELVDRASAALQEEDFSTAHYMATLARALEPGNDESARIASESLGRLESLAPDDEESGEYELFQAKQAAKAALTRGDTVDAYYRFVDLAGQYPRDVDVERYLRTAEEQVRSMAVFRDEVESAMGMPGAPDLVFVNRSGPDFVELLAVGKLVRTASGVYGQRIELVRIVPDGGRSLHVSSEYGKLTNGHFLVNVIDRESPALGMGPTVHAGSPPAELEHLIEVEPSAQELWLLGSVSRDPSTASMTALSRTVSVLDAYGLVPEPVEVEFLMRLVAPFTFLVLSLLLMGFGWRYRSRYLHLPPVPTLVLVPLAPVFILPFYLTLQFAQRLLVSTILLSLSVTVTAILTIVLQALLLFLALSYVALGTRE
ncbi:MAG: hypothetical protein ACOC2D_03435 [Spirochaetota bacterium]